MPTGREASYAAEISAPEGKAELSYFVEVIDENGNGPTRVGSPAAPLVRRPAVNAAPCAQIPGPAELSAAALTTQPPAPPPGRCEGSGRPFYCEPWVWVVTGVVVAAGTGVGLYLGRRHSEPKVTGIVALDITSPAPTGLRERP